MDARPPRVHATHGRARCRGTVPPVVRRVLLLAAMVAMLAACGDSDGPVATTTPATSRVRTTVTSPLTEPVPVTDPVAVTDGPSAATTTVVELGPEGLADCEVVLGVIAEVVQHPDTAEAVNADPALADEPATREAFDAVAVRFGALELRDPAVAAAAALVGQRALDVALAEGTATGLIEPYAESFVALSDVCAPVADAATS